jgi:arginyl-tRNA synthetase
MSIDRETALREQLSAVVAELGYPPRTIDLRRVPFSGSWGAASSVAKALSGQAAADQIAAETAGLDKKEARERAGQIAAAKAQEIAAQIAARLLAIGAADRVEAVNGFVNIYFDTASVAAQTVQRVATEGATYGRGQAVSERVLVEFSQPNTHKAFHVGHLRNVALGHSLSNILDFSGFTVLRANYIGDIGRHVISCLWCYRAFHEGQEPAEGRGRWLGQVYTESVQRLSYRQHVVDFINKLSAEDEAFKAASDRMMKELWRRKKASGEDIAYLLGQLSGKGELTLAKVHDPDCMADLWQIIGAQLQQEARPTRANAPVVDEATAAEQLRRWRELNEHADWWIPAGQWEREFKECWRLWEAQDPEFVALWERTKAWSMEEFHRIYAELNVPFDIWFYESELEEEGRVIVQELLDKGIAEISEGLPVVKIDEKLGLDKETYRVLPILRSDGTTLYSTKDLALTKRKFEDYQIDRAIWVVAVPQALYFQQVFKVLELWGFEQAKQSYHLPYEIVTLKEGMMSSRSGNAVLYEDVAPEVFGRARNIIDEKNPELPEEQKARVARQVGTGALLYSMLDRDNNRVITFDPAEAVSLHGQSAPYIQYAHARACRILKRAGTLPAAPVEADIFIDLCEQEINLIAQIALFPGEVQRAAREYKPLVIATYAYDLATLTNDFYEHCRVIDAPEPTRTARLAVVAATRQTLANALALLGIEAPEAM